MSRGECEVIPGVAALWERPLTIMSISSASARFQQSQRNAAVRCEAMPRPVSANVAVVMRCNSELLEPGRRKVLP